MNKRCSKNTNKILMLVENLSVPADRRIWSEASALRDGGFQVCVICPKGSGKDEESHVCIDNIDIYRYKLPVVGNKYIAYIAEYSIALLMTFLLSIKVLFRRGFDVIHAANPPDLFFLLAIGYQLLGKKFVFDQHDLAPEMFQVKFHGRMKFLHKLLLFFEWCSYQTADLVIVTNTSYQQIAMKRGGCSPEKVFVVRNGPDLHRLRPVEREPDLKMGRRYLLAYIGVMSTQDGVEYALHALHTLVHKRGRRDISLVLMGEGDQMLALQALAHTLQLNEYMNFTGWVASKDIRRYLSVADIGLLPDPKNGLNEYSTMIKTMEYMAMSKPLVAFDLAETRFSAQGAALYAAPNSVEDFAFAIERLLDDEELRMKMGALGRQRVEEQLSWEHAKNRLLQAYEVLLGRPSRAGRITNFPSLVTGQVMNDPAALLLNEDVG